jgi:hypothetical protein
VRLEKPRIETRSEITGKRYIKRLPPRNRKEQFQRDDELVEVDFEMAISV